MSSPSGESFGGESGEDDVVKGADADAGEHGGDGERGHRPGGGEAVITVTPFMM